MFHKVKYSSLNELVYEEIKSKIIDNELKPNQKLDIDFLSSSLGVSRTPVTNALKALNKVGYVTINPRSGSYVRELTKEETRSIFNFREAVERQVIREVIDITDENVLKGFYYEFKKLFRVEAGNSSEENKCLVDDFFNTEIKFHEYLIDLCPKIIGDEIKNLMDLTKRIRILHMVYKLNMSEIMNFREEVDIHCKLIDALIEKDLKKSVEIITQDIRNTKDEIMECFEEIN